MYIYILYCVYLNSVNQVFVYLFFLNKFLGIGVFKVFEGGGLLSELLLVTKLFEGQQRVHGYVKNLLFP